MAADAQATKYVDIKPGFGKYRLVYVDKPGKLRQWAHDTKSGIYYGSMESHGKVCPIYIKDKTKKVKTI